jgi:large subunit ribosomal protein L24
MCVLVQVDVAVPEWMQKMEQSDVPVRSMEAPVPLASVRLVYPLTDTETGETRDVIVKKLVNTAFFHSKALGRAFWKRMIPGLNVVVPWPKLPEAEKKDHDCDTLRLDVETRTFVPTLLRPPMPESIIDELRNKYSKFRTRHDPEYIEAKMQEDREAEEQKKRVAEVRTPLKDVHRRERKLKKAKGKGKLTPEMLEHLGKTIAQNKQLVVEPAASSTSSIEGATLAA